MLCQALDQASKVDKMPPLGALQLFKKADNKQKIAIQ